MKIKSLIQILIILSFITNNTFASIIYFNKNIFIISLNSDNLTLETKELAYNDIKDTYYTETKGSNFSTTIGSDPDKGKTNISPMGSTTIGLKSTGSEKEQDIKATIGNGNIVITNKVNGKEIIANEGGTTNQNDLLASLNRNKNNSQEITKDMITGALDGSMTIDNRLLLGFINQNVYERDENGKVKKDADGKSIVMKQRDKDGNLMLDKNGNSINQTTNGYKSVASDVRNFIPNTGLAVVGAVDSTKFVLDVASDIIGMIPGSPVWVSRKLTEETGIPPHLLPSLFVGDEVMGQATIVRDKDNKPDPIDKDRNQIIYEKKKVNIFVSDNNLLFKVLYALVPGAKSSTDQHDILMNKYQINSNLGLGATIAPSFATTYYGAIGTVFDFKNYGSNATKIKDSYDNSVPNGSIIINNQTGKIKVKFNPDPNFDYKGINIIRGKR